MNRSLLVPVSALLGLLAFPIGACAVAKGEEAVEADESQLRKLLPAEVVGTIGYGETKSVAYASEPRYRALAFTAAAGDVVDARFVGDKGLDTVGFLLSDSFGTLAQNDDESATSRASHLAFKVTTAGTYYLAVREANEEDGNIAITLAKTAGAPPPVKEPDPVAKDVFDPQSCTGPVFTQARAIKYFPKGSAAGDLTISAKKPRAYLRGRVCSEFSGCADWVTKEVTTPTNDSGLQHRGIGAQPGNLILRLSDRADNPIDVFFSVATGRYDSSSSYLTDRVGLGAYTKPGSASLSAYYGWGDMTAEAWDSRTWQYLTATVPLPVGEADLNIVPLSTIKWDTVLTEKCGEARFSTTKVSSGKQQRVEMQGVVHWELVAPTN